MPSFPAQWVEVFAGRAGRRGGGRPPAVRRRASKERAGGAQRLGRVGAGRVRSPGRGGERSRSTGARNHLRFAPRRPGRGSACAAGSRPPTAAGSSGHRRRRRRRVPTARWGSTQSPRTPRRSDTRSRRPARARRRAERFAASLRLLGWRRATSSRWPAAARVRCSREVAMACDFFVQDTDSRECPIVTNHARFA